MKLPPLPTCNYSWDTFWILPHQLTHPQHAANTDFACDYPKSPAIHTHIQMNQTKQTVVNR